MTNRNDAADAGVAVPDAGLIDAASLPRREPPEPLRARRRGFQVVLRRSTLDDVRGHGRSRPDVEVCGVLVGELARDEVGPWLDVSAGIRGEHAASDVAQVTFTAETWTHIQGVLDRDHPNLRVVGWYHTHPGFGIFLSPMDRFIHDNFFNEPWQVALVDDPLAGIDGLFVWRNGMPREEPCLVAEDVALPPAAASGDDAGGDDAGGDDAGGDDAAERIRVAVADAAEDAVRRDENEAAGRSRDRPRLDDLLHRACVGIVAVVVVGVAIVVLAATWGIRP